MQTEKSPCVKRLSYCSSHWRMSKELLSAALVSPENQLPESALVLNSVCVTKAQRRDRHPFSAIVPLHMSKEMSGSSC